MTYPEVSWDSLVKWGMRFLSTAILLMILLVFYWTAIDRNPPVNISHGEVIRYQSQLDGGWIMFVRWHGERFRHCNGNSKRWLSAGAYLPLPDIPYPPNPEENPLGPYQYEVPILIPSYFATTGHVRGTYSIRMIFACNPIQEYLFPIIVEPPSVPFALPNESPKPGAS